jgi:hypothetical protein
MDFIAFLFPVHLEILETIKQSNVVVTENHAVCKKYHIDGYTMTWKAPDNIGKKTTVAICNETIMQNYNDWIGEINRTLAHEAVHVAQDCKSNDGYIRPLGFRKDIEEEAFDIQDNPREVLRILKKYCL